MPVIPTLRADVRALPHPDEVFLYAQEQVKESDLGKTGEVEGFTYVIWEDGAGSVNTVLHKRTVDGGPEALIFTYSAESAMNRFGESDQTALKNVPEQYRFVETAEPLIWSFLKNDMSIPEDQKIAYATNVTWWDSQTETWEVDEDELARMDEVGDDNSLRAAFSLLKDSPDDLD